MSQQQPPSGNEQPWGPPQQPPAGAPLPAGTPPPSAATVVVPSWVSGDWLLALRIAGLGHLLLLAAATIITILAVLQQVAAVDLSSVDWGAAAVSPVVLLLDWFGGGAGTPLLLTSAVYLYLAYLFVGRRARELPPILDDRRRTLAAAAKIGLVAAAGLLVVGILLNTVAEDLMVQAFSLGLERRVDLTSLVFTALFIGIVVALLTLLTAGRTTLTDLLGLTISVPLVVRSGLDGGRRTLLVGGSGLLILATIGTLLDSLTRSGTTLSSAIGVLLQVGIELLVHGVDQAALLLLGASKFLHDGGYVWSPFGSTEGWMWLAIPILFGAYVAGGVAAARGSRPRSQAEAAKAAILVGPAVALVTTLVAIGWAGQPFIEDIVPIAIFLPSLWGILAIVGAWLWANQQGLPSGLVVERADGTSGGGAPPGEPPAAPPPGTAPPGAAAQAPPADGPPGHPASWAPPTMPPSSEPEQPTAPSDVDPRWAPPPGDRDPDGRGV